LPNPENIVKHKFKKGQSGNPDGRPVGVISVKALIRKVWSEELTDKDADGDPMVKAILSVKAMVDKAESGDVPAFKALVERLEGLPKQEIENTNKYSDGIEDVVKDILINGKRINILNGEEVKPIDREH